MNENTQIQPISFVDRLTTLVDIYGNGKKAQLARILGISEARLGMWYTRDYIDVVMVANALPDVNANWLLRGIGDPRDTATVAPVKEEQVEEIPKTVISVVEKENEVLKRENEILRAENLRYQKEHETFITKLMSMV